MQGNFERIQSKIKVFTLWRYHNRSALCRSKKSPLHEGKTVTLSYHFSTPLDKKVNQKVALNQKMKVFKRTQMVHMLTCAAQKLRSETRNTIWAIQRISAYAHLQKTEKKKRKIWCMPANYNDFLA